MFSSPQFLLALALVIVGGLWIGGCVNRANRERRAIAQRGELGVELAI